MDLSNSLNKSPYSNPKCKSLCDQDPWYYFLPISGSHRLKCNFNVTLERKGRDDVSCSYQWESSKIDWWLATYLDQIQLNEVSFRMKLLTWRYRSPLSRSGRIVPEFSYHWVRPGSEIEEDDTDNDNDENHLKPVPSNTLMRLFRPQLSSKRSILFFLIISVLIAVLVYNFS